MSLTTVTLALDDKLRSLRNSSLDSDHKLELEASAESNNNKSSANLKNPTVDRLQPLTLGGENIPYADESPERPLIQPRSKPIRVQTYNLSPSARYTTTTRLHSQGSTSPNTSPTDVMSSSQSHSSQENVVKVVGVPVVKAPSSVSSDDTDTSTTSNPMDTKCSSTIRIDREMIREMNRILTTLERKATKLNRSLSLNYKNHKGECCCNGTGTGPGLNNNNNYRSMSNNRFSLSKDEKTDKNINKKRQIQDVKNRRYTNRSIKRRHTVGGTHDYGSKTANTEPQCPQEGHLNGGNPLAATRTSSPDLTKDNQVLNDNKIISNE